MDEVLDGVFHWKAVHPRIGAKVDSHYVAGSGTAIDPLLPDEGIEWFDGRGVQEMDAICPEDTVLRIEAGGGTLLFADSVMNHGGLGFVSDQHLGDEAEAVKRRIRAHCKALLDENFRHLLFAHGDPLIGEGAQALRAFAEG